MLYMVNMKELLKKNEELKPLKVGDIVEGKIIARGKSAIYLDLGNKGTGIIYGREFFEAKDILKEIKIGEKVFAKVLDLDNEEGFVELSLSSASKELIFEKLKNENIIKVKILKANKGGLLTEISGIPAFLPVSQLSWKNYPRVKGDQEKILEKLQNFVGKEMEVKVLSLNKKGGQIIISERLAQLEKSKEILKKYKIGDIVEGEVTALTEFGAFLRFGEDLEGLIHVSEMGENVKDPSEILKIGDKVKAKIINIENEKVSLSLKV